MAPPGQVQKKEEQRQGVQIVNADQMTVDWVDTKGFGQMQSLRQSADMSNVTMTQEQFLDGFKEYTEQEGGLEDIAEQFNSLTPGQKSYYHEIAIRQTVNFFTSVETMKGMGGMGPSPERAQEVYNRYLVTDLFNIQAPEPETKPEPKPQPKQRDEGPPKMVKVRTADGMLSYRRVETEPRPAPSKKKGKAGPPPEPKVQQNVQLPNLPQYLSGFEGELADPGGSGYMAGVREGITVADAKEMDDSVQPKTCSPYVKDIDGKTYECVLDKESKGSCKAGSCGGKTFSYVKDSDGKTYPYILGSDGKHYILGSNYTLHVTAGIGTQFYWATKDMYFELGKRSGVAGPSMRTVPAHVAELEKEIARRHPDAGKICVRSSNTKLATDGVDMYRIKRVWEGMSETEQQNAAYEAGMTAEIIQTVNPDVEGQEAFNQAMISILSQKALAEAGMMMKTTIDWGGEMLPPDVEK